MASSVKKRGRRIIRKFSRVTTRASEDSKEHIKENLIKRFSHVENIKLLILEWGLLIMALVMLAATQSVWFKNSYSEDVFVEGGTYAEATLGKVNSLNPLFAMTGSEKTLSRLLFATLSTIDRTGHFGLGLASSILPNEDGKIWTVRLREGLKWSDGEEITIDDVIFTIDLIKNPAVNSIYDSNLANVKVTRGADNEVIFELPTPYADFISALDIPVIPKHALENVDPKLLVEDSFSSLPITSGAFEFNAVQPGASSDEQIFYLSANPNYHKGRTLLNTFAVHAFEGKEEIVHAINSGSVTATAELSQIESEQIQSGQFLKKNSDLNSGAFIFFNTTSGEMRKAELRTAIRQGIDIKKIREAAPDTLSLDYPLLTSQIELDNYPAIPERNEEAAKAKISELRGNETINVNVATVNSGYLPNVAEAIKGELANLGMDAHVMIYEENQEFIKNIISKRNYDILVYEVELGAGPDLLPYYHSSQASEAGLNLSNYRSSLSDDLLLAARDSLDEKLQIKKYEGFLERWVTDVPAIGLYQPNLTYIYNKNVRTFNDINLVTALDRFADITDWAATTATKNKTP